MIGNKYIKRFCLAVVDSNRIEEQSLLFKRDPHAENCISKIGIENLEVFIGHSLYFVILDIQPQLNFTDIRTRLKECSEDFPQKKMLLDIVGSQNVEILERIFKKEYADDHFTYKIASYRRTVMTLEIKNDPALLAEYIKIHEMDRVWPQILENMDTMGIKNMEIYLHGYTAFLIMDTRPDFDMAADGERWAKLPKEEEWQKYVAKFQKVDPHGNATMKWKVMNVLT